MANALSINTNSAPTSITAPAISTSHIATPPTPSFSKFKNPIRKVGVTQVWGTNDPTLFQSMGVLYDKEHSMVPQKFIDELSGMEKRIFGKLYAGNFSKKLYRLFEYQKG